MSSTNWKTIAAAVRGTSHLDKECQDAFAWQIFSDYHGSEVLIAVAADGAGSATQALVGAQATCASFAKEVSLLLEQEIEICHLSREWGARWLQSLQDELLADAKAGKQELRDYACTWLAAVIGQEAAVFFQIGDGAIVYHVIDEPNEYHLFEFPEQGEYANTTYFATDLGAAERMRYKLVEKQISEVAIFTDGLQRVALNYKSRKAHAPFFCSMFAPLRAAGDEDLAALERNLFDYLDSSIINERTDDDKTLLLASRRLRAALSQQENS